jgi:exosortase A
MNLKPMFSFVPHAWRSPLASLAVALVAILLLYRQTAIGMVTIWYKSETFAHGFVVFPIVLWLIWRKRAELVGLAPRPSPWLLVILAGLALMWLLGDLVAVNSITQLALVAMIVIAVPTVVGIPVATAIAFPLAFAFFAVPVGEFVMPQLMEWTADFTVLALRASGIPVYREGLNFVIPSGNWSVVEACSGVRYLIASLTVGTLFAYLTFQTTRRRVAFMLVALVVPVIANWLRAYMIVMLGHLSGNKIAVGVDHLIYGWVFFGIVILLMFFIGARWTEPEPSAAVPSQGGSPVTVLPHESGRQWLTVLALAFMISWPIGVKQALEPIAASAAPNLTVREPLSPKWQQTEATSLGYAPHFELPSTELNLAYGNDSVRVGMYLAYYRDQDYARKLVSSNNQLVISTDSQWSKVDQGSSRAELDGAAVTFRRIDLRRLPGAASSAPDRLRVWQVYWINGKWTSNDYLAKVYSAVYQLLGRGDDSAALVIYAPLDRTDSADRAFDAFLGANQESIGEMLRAAAANR